MASTNKQRRDRILNALQMTWGEYWDKRGRWSTAVKLRDKHCQHCSTVENLTVHHICPQTSFVHLVLEEWNGLTLCKSCHEKQHTLLGHLDTIVKIYLDKLET